MTFCSRAVSAGLAAVLAAAASPALAIAGCDPSITSTGAGNTCIGTFSLNSLGTGAQNTAIGAFALYKNTAGNNNTAVGVATLTGNALGGDNTAMGISALSTNYSGNFNTAFGSGALINNSKGNANTAIGYQAGGWASGSYNIALGAGAGGSQIQGSYNIAIGTPGAAGDRFTIRIGNKDRQTSAFIAGIRGVNVTNGQAVVVNAKGQLGSIVSSRRYKQDIQDMGDASAPLMKLRPVTFRYKEASEDGGRPLQFGLIAEEVAQTMPGLAVYDEDGAPVSVAYQVLPSLLLNEYQKQQRELVESRTALGSLRERLAAAETELGATEKKLAASETRLAAVEEQLAALNGMLDTLVASRAERVNFAPSP